MVLPQVITGVSKGTATVTHGYYNNGWYYTETFNVTVSGYKLYFYALIPGKNADDKTDPNTRWFGLGVGGIDGEYLEHLANILRIRELIIALLQ